MPDPEHQPVVEVDRDLQRARVELPSGSMVSRWLDPHGGLTIAVGGINGTAAIRLNECDVEPLRRALEALK